MMKHFVILICLFLSTMEVSASRQDKEKGDSIYDRMVELSLLREDEQFKYRLSLISRQYAEYGGFA